MIVIVFLLISLSFLILYWIATNKKRNRQINKPISAVNRSTLKIPETKKTESLSDFQQWILAYAQKTNADELEESLRLPFKKNDWKLLEPSVFAKWSKFKWGI